VQHYSSKRGACIGWGACARGAFGISTVRPQIL
jgi:hypothetical protein